MFEHEMSKINFKFDMGLNEEGKTMIASRTYDFLKQDFEDTGALQELGSLIATIIDANSVVETRRVTYEYVL